MAKVAINDEEWFPVYEIQEEGRGKEVEIPDDKLEHINKIFLEFKECQQYLKKLFKNV